MNSSNAHSRWKWREREIVDPATNGMLPKTLVNIMNGIFRLLHHR